MNSFTLMAQRAELPNSIQRHASFFFLLFQTTASCRQSANLQSYKNINPSCKKNKMQEQFKSDPCVKSLWPTYMGNFPYTFWKKSVRVFTGLYFQYNSLYIPTWRRHQSLVLNKTAQGVGGGKWVDTIPCSSNNTCYDLWWFS